jgi:hypothetical protein
MDRVHSRLDECISESNSPSVIAQHIVNSFTMNELTKVIEILLPIYERAPNLLFDFWQRSSDACPLEASEAEKQENAFFDWVTKLKEPKQ